MTYNEQSRRDTVKDYRPQIVRPIKYKPKADEQVLYFANRKPVIVRRKNAQVSKDNRSNYQRRVDQKTTVYAKQKHEQQRDYEEAAKGVEAITKLVSPSTYIGAAARSLTGNGTFGSNLTSGTGFNDTAANIAFDVASPFILKSITSTLGKVTNPIFNKLRNYILSRQLNNNVRRWDGTVGMEYFNSPNNWYRWTETPEIEGIREVGKNVTTRDAADINVPSNNWRIAAMDNYSKSKEGYWYKADIPDENMSLSEYLDYLKNNTNKNISSGRKYGSAHGNKSQASYGKAWDGSLSTSGIGQLGLLEGQAGIQIPFGKTRTSFTLTPIEEVPIGGRVGFSTGEMPMDNLGWFTKLPNGRFKYNGQVLPYKQIEILENQGKGRYQFDRPTYQVYTGPQHDISEVINNRDVNLPKLMKIQDEALKNIPNGTIARHRLENKKWHPTDWNTFLHTRDVYQRALQYGYPEEALFPALMHDAGKLWTGDGHGPYGASIIQQMFPKASKEQIQAIYGHMDNDPVAPLTKWVKGVDIKEPNKFRYLYEKEK